MRIVSAVGMGILKSTPALEHQHGRDAVCTRTRAPYKGLLKSPNLPTTLVI